MNTTHRTPIDEPLKLWLSIELGKYKERVAYRQDAICLFLEQDELENALMNWVRSWVEDIKKGNYHTEKGQKSFRKATGYPAGQPPEYRREYDKIR